jgi:hypothetical protein
VRRGVLRQREAQLADEQAALRRVATVGAQGASPTEAFAAVAREIAHALDLPLVEMCRYEPDEMATVIASTALPYLTALLLGVVEGLLSRAPRSWRAWWRR